MNGIIYLNKGGKCLIRCLVSLYSLRKHYNGPVTVLEADDPPVWFKAILKELGVQEKRIVDDTAPLVLKSLLHQYTPYSKTMFIDADTLILRPVDEYFELLGEHAFIVGDFAGWRTSGNIIGGRIRRMATVCSDTIVNKALEYGPAVNTGIFGFSGSPASKHFLDCWGKLTILADKMDCSPIPDELACQMLLPFNDCVIAGVEWGTSVKYGTVTPDTRIIHYHGRKHVAGYPACELWKHEYDEVLARWCTYKWELMQDYGDRKLRYYQANTYAIPEATPTPATTTDTIEEPRHEDTLTFVTAADETYLDRLKAHFPQWMALEPMRSSKWICFINGMRISDPRLDFLPPIVKRVQWSAPSESQREQMLAAFVFGAAAHVDTERWVKIDADVRPLEGCKGLSFPIVALDSVICAHRWGYTKPGAFLRRLEDWADTNSLFVNSERVFTEEQLAEADKCARYGHGRIASFICLHNSEFVRMCAAACPGRLPVPSHDTFLWYCAERLGMKPLGINIKQQGWSPR